MSNKNLNKAKVAANDEFYTQLSDIEKELQHYKDHFKDKVIFLNCDDPEESNFWKYFELNFEFLGLKKLISTHFHTDRQTYKLEIIGDINGDGKVNKADIIKTVLTGNGDFRSPESIEILKEADIVVTNPPFSLFREFIDVLMTYQKKFIVIGNMNAITYKECFRHIKNNEIWLGCTNPKIFEIPSHYPLIGSAFEENGKKYAKLGNVCWFTNLPHNKRNEKLILYKTYNETDYPKYDNYDCIEVSKTKDIPKDYKGIMGVPISFLDKYNPEQFEILGNSNVTGFREYLMNGIISATNCTYINGKPQYARILIKNKQL